MLDQLISVVLSVFDRYPVPPSIGEEAWLAARSDLAHRLDLVGGHARKRVMDIPEPLAEAYFAMMPIHEKLRGRDFQTTRNYLRVSLCNIHDELISRMDRAGAGTGIDHGCRGIDLPIDPRAAAGREGRWTGPVAAPRFCRSTLLSSTPKPPGSIHARRG